MIDQMTPAQRRNARLVATYGITEDQYMQMLVEQGNRCLVCGREYDPQRPFAVDHNHETGVVRGLLCQECNTGIGLLGDDMVVLAQALIYLAHHGAVGKDQEPPPVVQSHPGPIEDRTEGQSKIPTAGSS